MTITVERCLEWNEELKKRKEESERRDEVRKAILESLDFTNRGDKFGLRSAKFHQEINNYSNLETDGEPEMEIRLLEVRSSATEMKAWMAEFEVLTAINEAFALEVQAWNEELSVWVLKTTLCVQFIHELGVEYEFSFS